MQTFPDKSGRYHVRSPNFPIFILVRTLKKRLKYNNNYNIFLFDILLCVCYLPSRLI